MNGYYNYSKESKGTVAKRRAVLLVPFVFFAVAVALICAFMADVFVFGSPYWNAVFTETVVETEQENLNYISKEKTERPVQPQQAEDGVTVTPPVLQPMEPETEEKPFSYLDELPSLEENAYISSAEVGGFALGELWATISVNGDELVQEIPVYQGDNSSILSQGVGHLYGSSFPGEGGVCVLPAHVSGRLGYFGNLANTDIYKEGTQIKLDTAYGVYVYEVVHTEILNYTDTKYVRKYGYENGKTVNYYDILTEKFGADELLAMYTCYPAGTSFRTQRYFVIARRIYGYSWR
ncbi:MAG: sortase [Clostridia bacterium]|nr:sortase [Clostridia bacterium]